MPEPAPGEVTKRAAVAPLATIHGGMIEFDSGAEGTTFVVRLPVYEEQLDGA